jgi:hypothetical protein
MDKPGHFSGDSRWFTSLTFNNLGRYALSTLSLRIHGGYNMLLSGWSSSHHLILAERACPEPTFSLFRAALAKEYLVLIFNY